MDGKSGQEAWELLKNKIHESVDKHVPMRRPRNHNSPAWLSQNILRAIRRKKRLWTKAKSGECVEEYRKEEKSVRNMKDPANTVLYEGNRVLATCCHFWTRSRRRRTTARWRTSSSWTLLRHLTRYQSRGSFGRFVPMALEASCTAG